VLLHTRRGKCPPSGFLVVALVLAALPLAATAQPTEETQTVRLIGWAGFQFTTPVTTASGTVSVDAAPTYGAAFNLAFGPELDLELLWTLSPTQAHYVSTSGVATSGSNHLNISYFQAGLTKSIRCGDFECFGDFTLGAVLLSPGGILLSSGQRLNVHDTWRGAFTFGAGIRFFLVQQLAVVLQARLLVPVYITSGGFYAGSGGTVLVVGAGIPCVEGAFSAGLVLAL
jgi:hypothetical protein